MTSKEYIDGLAKAIYNANRKPDREDLSRSPPIWENLSKDVQDWVRRQAVAADIFMNGTKDG
jgi:hypothetical protein